MKSFILFAITLLLFIVHVSTMDGDGYSDHDRWTQNTVNSFFGPINPYGNQNTHQSNGYYGQPSAAGGYGGFHQQPPPPYGYAHQQSNFHRSQSDFHPYNHNQPPPAGNYGRSQSDVHNHQQSTSYSNDSDDEETHRPGAGNYN
ncbi:hypothetical protein niasHT_003232 [Heterodera trifolii]|uniref:Effector protein n=1 Tax=Heterodera trifolii TaxID=157864 RepID=A0ABD2MAC0_9BILA